MPLFSSKESFRTLHESLGLLKQMIMQQEATLADEIKNVQSQLTVTNGNVLDGQTDMKIFLTDKEERHEKHLGDLALTLAKHLDEALQILRLLNEAAAVEKVQSAEILRVLNEALGKQGTDIAELQRKVVILQARKA